ncbi:MAG: hypothetical protein ACTHOO_04530 [Alcanivorax sp.]
MPIMHDIKMTIATAVAAAGLSVSAPALAQEAEFERASDTTEVVQSSSQNQQVPETELKFRTAKLPNGEMAEITPEIVQEYAHKDQFKIPSAREEEVLPIRSFMIYADHIADTKRAAIFIGVVVDDEPYKPLSPGYEGRDHFRDVQRSITHLVTGYDPDIPRNEQEQGQSIAEIYGAEVQAIVPLRYKEGLAYTNPDGVKHDIRVNDIIMMINDHFIPVELEGGNHFPGDVQEMEEWLKYFLDRDMHRYSRQEYFANKEEIRANADRRYSGIELVLDEDRRETNLRGDAAGGSRAGTVAALQND